MVIADELDLLDAAMEIDEDILLDNALRARCPSGPAPEWPDDEEQE